MSGEAWSQKRPPCPSGTPAITAVLTQPQPDTTVCTVTGTMNPDTVSVLSDALAGAQCDDNAHLVIDLSAVTSMDSAGLFALLEARHKHNLGGSGHLTAVINSTSQAIPQLYIVSLKASFDLHHSLAEALHACANAGTAK